MPTSLCGVDVLCAISTVLLVLHAASRSGTQVMIGIGRRGLHKSLNRVCCSQSGPASVVHYLTSLSLTPACTYNDNLPSQPSSWPASRHFATASLDKYDPQGEMSAVTFHGPRTMKVSKKPKPRLQTPGVHTLDTSTCQCYAAPSYCSSTAPWEGEEHAKLLQ